MMMPFTYLLFLFPLMVMIIIFIILRKLWWCCNCHVCRSYLTSSWTNTFQNLCDWYTHLLRTSPTGTIHVHVLGNVITANPDNVEHILKTRFENYPKGKPFSAILGDLLGRGIFNADGDLWRFQRKLASLELSNSSVKTHAFEIVTCLTRHRLVPLLASASRHGAVMDLQDVFRRFSLDSICKFSFGLDPACLKINLPMSDFAVAFDLASRLSAERAMTASPVAWKVKRVLNVGSERKLRDAIKMVDVLADEVIKEKRKTKTNNYKDGDLLSRFMGSTEDDKFLRDIVISFLLAGRDTVASALTSFFWILASHEDVHGAILKESDRFMKPGQETATYDQVRGMHYLTAAVYECMRLYPPVQFDSKFCAEDDTLPDGTFVKKGTRVTYHPYAMGRMETVWGPDCLEFKPERWLDQDGVFRQENPFKYPVFQAGFRVCLGKEMAIVEVKTVALSLIRRFNIRVVSSHKEPAFTPGLTATVRGGLPVMIQEKEAALG